jgi:hypothetical protein
MNSEQAQTSIIFLVAPHLTRLCVHDLSLRFSRCFVTVIILVTVIPYLFAFIVSALKHA